MRVLVVEDDTAISKPMRQALERERFSVAVCDTGSVAIELAASWSPDIVLLDLFLPDCDGIEIIGDLFKCSRPGVIVVTARTEEHDRVAALEAGADDYLPKPFSASELLARMRAVHRRLAELQPEPATIRAGGLLLEESARRVTHEGRDLPLTNKEFELLRLLMRRPGLLVHRGELVRALWNTSADEIGNTLDVHVSSLRRKLGDDAKEPRFVETIRGVGFRFIGV